MNKNWIFFIAILFLSACSGETCIEADDFGHEHFTVSSRYTKEEFGPEQLGDSQVGPWRDSNYLVNGRPLTIAVRGWDYNVDYNTPDDLSAWCAWYGQSDNTNTLSKICERLPDCQFVDNLMCTQTNDARIGNAPCLFRNGIGLYALIAEKDRDPNMTLSTKRSPQGLSFHVGESVSGYQMYEFDKRGDVRNVGGRVYDYGSDSVKKQYSGAKLYFKILDKFYDDNNGQYKIIIKSGISRTNPDPISYATELVKTFLFGVDNDYGLIRNLYLGVVNQAGYRLAVSALLTLYIMFTGLSYLTGNLQITHTELLIRISKIAIVSALLSSEYSWNFFNNYLFVYFIGGVEQILQLIMEAGATGPGSPSILAMMMAPQTLSKLLSLLFTDWMGFIYIILFIVALYFVVMVFFKAAVIYLTALIAIGMIIVMGPIFICFLLFGITRSLFENWLRQLISYAIQPIILFTGLIFISMILRQEIYGSLGFRVCKKGFPKMNSGNESLFAQNTDNTIAEGLKGSIFYWWFPDPMQGQNFTRETRPIPVPIDHFTTDNNVIGTVSDTGFCEAYGCIEDRYIDLPFLDPNSSRDQRRLQQFWVGNFVQFDGLLLIFLAIYLLHKFNGLTLSVARFLSGTSGNLTEIGNVSSGVGAQTFGRLNNKMSGIPSWAVDKTIGMGNRDVGRARRQGLLMALREAPSAFVDKVRIKGMFGRGGLEREALSKNANNAILSEVQRKTGLKQSDINKNAIKDYRKNLANKLQTINNNLSNKEANKLAKLLSKRKPRDLNNEFAKAKFDKEYKDLNKEQQQYIKNLNDITLRKLAKDSEQAKQFQKAYVDAYAAMSDRGIGIVGKNSKIIRSLEEIKHDYKQRKKIKKAKEQQIGKEIYSEIAGVKAGVFKAVTGGKYDPRHRDDGSNWHGINTDSNARNYTKQTYSERLQDEKQGVRDTELARDIDKLSRKYDTNVISPEFLAQAKRENNPNLSKFYGLEKENVRTIVRNYLRQGQDPAFKGHSYMSGQAKDSEMRRMIDNSYDLTHRIFAEDAFISRQEEYKMTYQLSIENIKSVYNDLGDKGLNVSPEELPAVMEDYYKDLMSKEKSKEKIQEFKKSLKDFNSTQEILEQIDQRKREVLNEIEDHVSKINEYRHDAKMKEYKSSKIPDLDLHKMQKLENLIPK